MYALTNTYVLMYTELFKFVHMPFKTKVHDSLNNVNPLFAKSYLCEPNKSSCLLQFQYPIQFMILYSFTFSDSYTYHKPPPAFL